MEAVETKIGDEAVSEGIEVREVSSETDPIQPEISQLPSSSTDSDEEDNKNTEENNNKKESI